MFIKFKLSVDSLFKFSLGIFFWIDVKNCSILVLNKLYVSSIFKFIIVFISFDTFSTILSVADFCSLIIWFNLVWISKGLCL